MWGTLAVSREGSWYVSRNGIVSCIQANSNAHIDHGDDGDDDNGGGDDKKTEKHNCRFTVHSQRGELTQARTLMSLGTEITRQTHKTSLKYRHSTSTCCEATAQLINRMEFKSFSCIFRLKPLSNEDGRTSEYLETKSRGRGLGVRDDEGVEMGRGEGIGHF